RWWFWAGTGFMLVAVCAGYLLIPVGGRISQANCDKIQPGWALAQVQELLGEDCVQGWLSAHWFDEDHNWIVVNLDPDDLVTATLFVPSTIPAYERMKRRMGRRVRALWPAAPWPKENPEPGFPGGKALWR
ncbi:MAG TPA: hypothetical protein VG125_12145, partial [Pirellulales bacterium]|nr:hypothetical protein [Pirellulales bacterium]